MLSWSLLFVFHGRVLYSFVSSGPVTNVIKTACLGPVTSIVSHQPTLTLKSATDEKFPVSDLGVRHMSVTVPDFTPLSFQTRFLGSSICFNTILGIPFLSYMVKHVNWATSVICLVNVKGHDYMVQMVYDAYPQYFSQSTTSVTDTVQSFASSHAM